MSRPPRPDFVIIGAMKCATSTLHVQLAAQPGFHMSTPKEPNFFSDDDVYAQGLDWYRGLFAEAKDGDLRGESSTHYTKLPTYPQTLARFDEELGDPPPKLIYLMRHPMDRLVSHYIHEWSQGVLSSDINTAVQQHPPLKAYSCYHQQLAPWIEAYGREQILPLFFDGLRAHPQQTLERVCTFLGYTGTPQWQHVQAAQNVSAQRMRKSPVRDSIAAFPPIRWLRRTLMPESLRDRIKSRWMMKERPQLDAATEAALQEHFDQDLAQLGACFDIHLTCANWQDVAPETELQWSPS